MIEPNVTINVADHIGAELKIISSHLHTCNGRWNGIVALRNSRVVIDGTEDNTNNIHTSTLIEDAEIAITQNGEVKDPTGDDPILSINNTIFNRNNIGIKITDPFYYSTGIGFNTKTATKNLYNCDIKNILFTSREIPFTQGQYDWHNFETISGNKSVLYPGIPSSYAAPYIDDATYFDNKPKAFLKDPINLGIYTTQKPLAGIVLDNLSFVNVNNEKTSVKIGTETPVGDFGQINIFDNLQYGIKANDANFIVTNCSFQKPVGVGIGIYADLNGDNFHYGGTVAGNFKNINKAVISKNAGKPANAFFNMNNAISITGYDEVEVKGCEIRSNQDYTSIAKNGEYGISVGSNVFSKIVIEKNNIANIRNGISYGGAAEGGQNYFGILEINNNVINKELSVGDMPNGFVENAITASAYVEAKYSNSIPLNVKDNKIFNAYNGVWLSGWISKNFNVLNNEIHLETDASIAPSGKHYGIKVDGGYTADLQYQYATDENGGLILDPQGNPTTIPFGSTGTNLIQDNKIYGAGITPTVGVKPNAGIWLSQQFNTNIGCNKVWASDNAYKFEGLCLLTKFMDNFIYEDNHYGYALYEGAQIGKQGQEVNSTATSDDVCVSNNDFNDKNAWITAYTSTKQSMTYTNNSDPLKSPLVIRTGAAYNRFNPDGVSWADPSLTQFIYGIGNGLVTTSTLYDGLECERCALHPEAKHIKHSLIELMEEIAAGTTTIPNDQPFERLEVMQQQLYELVRARPEIAQNSSDIQQFIYDNQWSSLDFIYYAGYYASKGNMDMVNSLLNYWIPTNSEQDNNYHTYYEWLVAMYNNPKWKPDIELVREMANKCPIKDGTVIYAARNLYNALTRKINKFDNACEGNNTGARGIKKQVEMIRLKQPKAKTVVDYKNQTVSIYPNPAKSIVNITTVKDGIKQIEFVSVLGKTVKIVSVSNLKNTQVNTSDIQKGIFLIKITTSKNEVIIQKLIIE